MIVIKRDDGRKQFFKGLTSFKEYLIKVALKQTNIDKYYTYEFDYQYGIKKIVLHFSAYWSNEVVMETKDVDKNELYKVCYETREETMSISDMIEDWWSK